MSEKLLNGNVRNDAEYEKRTTALPEGLESLYAKEMIEKHCFFFDKLINDLGLEKTDADLVAVLHILPQSVPFTQALSKIFNINSIVPKPKSINRSVLRQIPQEIIANTGRQNILEIINRVDKPTVFLDIGGYFSRIVNELDHKLGPNFKGIVEDTENGLQRYEKIGINYPFVSVARSPLKENEDMMVGQAISYSAEALLRQHNILLAGLKVGVLGFGKVGRAVAESVREKHGNVAVYDTDNIRLTSAVSLGQSISDKDQVLRESDAICLATGNVSLSGDDYTKLKKGCWVFSVTSADDELDKRWLEENYQNEQISQFATKFFRDDHYFFLLNEGNAINFIHGATAGDFILLVHSELMVAAYKLVTNQLPIDQHELDSQTRDKICKVWLSVFRDIK